MCREQLRVRTELLSGLEKTTRLDMDAVRVVGGTDVSFVKGSDEACACISVVDFSSLELIGCVLLRVRMCAPYVPGYLAFREVESLRYLLDFIRSGKAHPSPAPEPIPESVHAIGAVEVVVGPGYRAGGGGSSLPAPDVVLVDGNGLLHPRRCGLASHLGVVGGWRTVGVGKNLAAVGDLTREYVEALVEEARARGDRQVPLEAVSDDMRETEGEGVEKRVLGVALLSPKSDKRPVFVSVGHDISLDDAVSLVDRCMKFRVPEPIRAADGASRTLLRALGAASEE
jgi:endonuclease V